MSKLPRHHAVLACGKIENSLEYIRIGLQNRGIEITNNPDVNFFQYRILGINESRELTAASLGAPLGNGNKSIVISFESITTEAQNALLKLFEDPNPRSEFFITIRNANMLLPTLRSRFFVVNLEDNDEDLTIAKKFISLSVGDRMKQIDNMLQAYKEDGKKVAIIKFLRAVHLELEKHPKENTEVLSTSARSLSLINDKSASVKILLESLALAL